MIHSEETNVSKEHEKLIEIVTGHILWAMQHCDVCIDEDMVFGWLLQSIGGIENLTTDQEPLLEGMAHEVHYLVTHFPLSGDTIYELLLRAVAISQGAMPS